MPSVKRLWQFAIFVVAITVITYIGIFIYAHNSDAFKTFSRDIIQTGQLEPVIGDVKRVRLDPFSRYAQRTSGTEGTASFVAVIEGTTKSARVHARMRLHEGKWTVEASEVIPK